MVGTPPMTSKAAASTLCCHVASKQVELEATTQGALGLRQPVNASPVVRSLRRTGRGRKLMAPGETACQFYLFNSKVALAAIHLRRVRIAGRKFAAALAHLSTVVTPPVPVAQNIGVALVVHRRYLAMVPRPLPSAPRRCRSRRRMIRQICSGTAINVTGIICTVAR
jgi:hypothetical protein